MNPLITLEAPLAMHEAKQELDELLTMLVELGGSDLHITAGIGSTVIWNRWPAATGWPRSTPRP
jgi:hypothetical protein